MLIPRRTTISLRQRFHQMDGKATLSSMGLIALMLWVITIAAFSWFFVKGWTTEGSDGRVEILLAPVERDEILAEMRHLLKAIDGIIRGLGEPKPDLRRMEETARAVGMHMAADVSRLSWRSCRCRLSRWACRSTRIWMRWLMRSSGMRHRNKSCSVCRA